MEGEDGDDTCGVKKEYLCDWLLLCVGLDLVDGRRREKN